MKNFDLETIENFPKEYLAKLKALGVYNALQFLGMCYSKDTYGVLSMYLETPRLELGKTVRIIESLYSEEELKELKTPVLYSGTGAIIE